MAGTDRTVITSSEAPQPLGAYSVGMSVSPGKLVYVAGQVSVDSSGNLVGKGDVVAQTRQALQNIGHVLAAAGAGFSIAMACDLVLAREDAVFTVAYSRIGASPDGSMSYFLVRSLGMRRAMELYRTNRVLTAQEAMEWGLVNGVLPEANFLADAKAQALLEPRYATSAPIVAETLDALAEQLPLDRDRFLRTVAEYNAAVDDRARFDPTVRDGLAALTVEPPKSNWAQRLDTPPFYAYPVTGGITFTFGGVRVDQRAQVVGTDWAPLAGLYACGEMVGGLFHHNYPGGAGLMAGAVFGRLAGASAAADV